MDRIRLPPTALTWVAVLGPFGLAALLVTLRGTLDPTSLALILVVAVVGAAATGRRWVGAGAAVTAAIGFDFFLTRPYYSFTINSRDDVETVVVLLIVGLLVAEIALRGRAARALAEDRSHDIDRVHDVRSRLDSGAHPVAVGDAIANELRELLPLGSCRYEPNRRGRRAPVLHHDGTIEMATGVWSVGSRGFPREIVEIPIEAHHEDHGRFLLVPIVGTAVDPAKLRVALTLVGQFASMQPNRASED